MPPQAQAGYAFLCTQLNLLLPIGHFGLDLENKPYLRAELKGRERRISGLIVLEVLEQMMFFSQELGYHLERVAQQKLSARASIQEIEIALGLL